jgi:integrase
MSNRTALRGAPTPRNVTNREAANSFLRHVENLGKSTKDHRSVLLGATLRLIGKESAGDALCQTRLGPKPVRRSTAEDYRAWFAQRHDGLAASTRKRGMSTMRSYLRYCVANGWADASVLNACGTVRASPPRRDWLRPEQVKAIVPLLATPEYDDYDRFAFETLLTTGLRISELTALRRKHLNALDGVLVVERGKGGKRREVPVDELFVAAWQAHAQGFELSAEHFMFFYRRFAQAPNKPRGTMAVAEQDRRRAATAKPIRVMLVRLTRDARQELNADLQPSSDITPHVLRRTYACLQTIAAELASDGGGRALGMRALQEAMGHSSLETTAQYLADVASYLQRHRRVHGTLQAVESILSWVRAGGADPKA